MHVGYRHEMGDMEEALLYCSVNFYMNANTHFFFLPVY